MKLTNSFLKHSLYIISFIFVDILIIAIPLSVVMNKTVMTFMQKHDVLLTTVFIILIVNAGIVVLLFIRTKPYSIWNFLIKQLSIYMLIGLMCMVALRTFLPTKHDTKIDVSHAISYANVSFWMITITFVLISIVSLYLNASYIEKNNWCIFFTLAPNIIFLGLLYLIYVSWQYWLNLDDVNIKKILEMFKFYERGNMDIDISLLNPFLQSVSMYTFILFFLIVMIVGGTSIVNFEKKAIEKHKKETKI